VTSRLHVLLDELRFKPRPDDYAVLKAVTTNKVESPYARICAAYFLLNSDFEARALLTNYVASTNARHRFNAASAIQQFAWWADGEPREWATVELLKMLENKSLEIEGGTYSPSKGYEENGCDMMDDILTPLHYVIRTLGDLKERRAIPMLEQLIERDGRDSYYATEALGNIGDPAAGPFLLSKYDSENWRSLGQALATLKYLPAVPKMIARLKLAEPGFDAERILDNLADIGDASVVPAVQDYLQSLPPGEQRERKVAVRVLAQLGEKDPVAALLALLDEETDKLEKVELIRALGRFVDQRSIDKLALLAVTSDHTLYRGNAIRTLGRMEDRKALLALVSILETNAPSPVEFDKVAILDGRPPDYSKKMAERQLREATRQDFRADPDQWRQWIIDNH